jgi:hypothetical protein
LSSFQPLWDQPVKFYWLRQDRFEETVHCICFGFLRASCMLFHQIFVNSYPVDEITLLSHMIFNNALCLR